ncbi:hypothetical protein A2U01_0062312, partial [Trifolium medium]|nr:hypothetical protein [Trifolium medium]
MASESYPIRTDIPIRSDTLSIRIEG